MRLSSLFCDGMVLQQEKPITVFGTGDGQDTVRVDFCGTHSETAVQFAHWQLTLPAQKAGGPYEMRFTFTESGKTRALVLHDVLIGEVWIAGGQSNMSMKLRDAAHTDADLTAEPEIRYFGVSRAEWPEGTEALDNRWTAYTPEAAPDFSAIGAFFAKHLHRAKRVPVGIICCCKGASRIESWLDPTLLAGTELDIPRERKHMDVNYPFNPMGMLYHRMVSPIAPYAVRGVLWYQGESDRAPTEACVYSGLFGILLKSWRRLWQDELPFLTVQLTTYGGDRSEQDWPTLREQQRICAEKYPGVAMITSMDCGGVGVIHPVAKKPIGERLSLAALHTVYGEAVEYSGPLAAWAECSGKTVTVHFDHAENSLQCTGALTNLVLSGGDGVCHPATGEISADGKTLIVTCEAVEEPWGVRYAWENDAEVTLCNAEGLPAAPFMLSTR